MVREAQAGIRTQPGDTNGEASKLYWLGTMAALCSRNGDKLRHYFDRPGEGPIATKQFQQPFQRVCAQSSDPL